MTADPYEPPDPLPRLGWRITRNVLPEGISWEFRSPALRRAAVGLLGATIAFVVLRAGTVPHAWLAWIVLGVCAGYATLIPRSRLLVAHDRWELERRFHLLSGPIALFRSRRRLSAVRLDAVTRSARGMPRVELRVRSDEGVHTVASFACWFTLSLRDRTESAVRTLVDQIHADARRVGARTFGSSRSRAGPKVDAPYTSSPAVTSERESSSSSTPSSRG